MIPRNSNPRLEEWHLISPNVFELLRRGLSYLPGSAFLLQQCLSSIIVNIILTWTSFCFVHNIISFLLFFHIGESGSKYLNTKDYITVAY